MEVGNASIECAALDVVESIGNTVISFVPVEVLVLDDANADLLSFNQVHSNRVVLAVSVELSVDGDIRNISIVRVVPSFVLSQGALDN